MMPKDKYSRRKLMKIETLLLSIFTVVVSFVSAFVRARKLARKRMRKTLILSGERYSALLLFEKRVLPSVFVDYAVRIFQPRRQTVGE